MALAAVVGGSAGSVPAICQLFAALAADTGLAYVVALHMPRGHPSHLVELLQRRTPMRVVSAADGMSLEADCVHVVPAGLALAWTGRRLALVAPAVPHARPCLIDLTLRAVADFCGGRSVGVLLSGAGSDGAEGLRHLCALGGRALVQDPAEAEVADMPLAALATGAAEAPMSIAGIAARLNERPATVRDVPAVAALVQAPRRAAALVDARRTRSVPARFFEDPAAHAALGAMLGRLFEGRPPGQVFKAWVPVCGTGAGAYSLAMDLSEHVARLGAAAPALRIIASDPDPEAIDIARGGCYDALDALSMTAARLERHFVRESAGYRAGAALRANVVFAVHDLFADTPFAALDLVWCPRLHEHVGAAGFGRALRIFEYALRPGGLLAAGTRGFHAEEAGFESIGLELRRRRIARRPARFVAKEPVDLPIVLAFDRSRAEVHLRLIERYAPPSLLVDADLRVLHLSSGAARLLQLGGGEPRLDLLHLLPAALQRALLNAIGRVARSGRPIEHVDVAADIGGQPSRLDVRVLPAGDVAPGCLLVELVERPATTGAAGDACSSRLRSGSVGGAREQRIDDMLAALPLDAYTLDLHKRFVLASPAVERRYGLTRAQIVGRSLREAGCGEALAERLEQAAQRVIDTAVGTGSGGDDRALAPVADAGVEYGFAPLLAPDGAVEAVLGWSRRVAEPAA